MNIIQNYTDAQERLEISQEVLEEFIHELYPKYKDYRIEIGSVSDERLNFSVWYPGADCSDGDSLPLHVFP